MLIITAVVKMEIGAMISAKAVAYKRANGFCETCGSYSPKLRAFRSHMDGNGEWQFIVQCRPCRMEHLRQSPRYAAFRAYLRGDGWAKRRARALDFAGGSCQLCKGVARLQVHHNTYQRLGQERDSDLIVLCGPCHDHFHKGRHVGTASWHWPEELGFAGYEG